MTPSQSDTATGPAPALDAIVSAGTLREAIGLALGAASMCWTPRPEGQFQSVPAVAVMEALYQRVRAGYAGGVLTDEPGPVELDLSLHFRRYEPTDPITIASQDMDGRYRSGAEIADLLREAADQCDGWPAEEAGEPPRTSECPGPDGDDCFVLGPEIIATTATPTTHTVISWQGRHFRAVEV